MIQTRSPQQKIPFHLETLGIRRVAGEEGTAGHPSLADPPRLAGAMDEESAELLILDLTVEHLMRERDWPELRVLHRRIHKEFGEDLEVADVARRVSPSPFFSGYDLRDRFVPPLFQLARVQSGAALIQVVVDFVQFAVQKYLSTEGDVEVIETELVVEGFDANLVPLIPTLIDRVPFVSGGRSTREGMWTMELSDKITRLKAIKTPADLLAFLREVEEQSKREAVALTEAKSRLIRTPSSAPEASEIGPTPIDDSIARAERHPLIRALLLVGAVAVALGAVVGLILGLRELLGVP